MPNSFPSVPPEVPESDADSEDPKDKARRLLAMAEMVTGSATKTKENLSMGIFNDSGVLDGTVDISKEFGMSINSQDGLATFSTAHDRGGDTDGENGNAGGDREGVIGGDGDEDEFKDASEHAPDGGEAGQRYRPDGEERALAERLSSFNKQDDGEGGGGGGGDADGDDEDVDDNDSASAVRSAPDDADEEGSRAQIRRKSGDSLGDVLPRVRSGDDISISSSRSRRSKDKGNSSYSSKRREGKRSGTLSDRAKERKTRSSAGGGDGAGASASQRRSSGGGAVAPSPNLHPLDDSMRSSGSGSGGDAEQLRDQLEKARRALLQVRENASLKYRKLELEHSSLKKEMAKLKDKLERQSRQLKTKEADVAHARKERDESKDELARELGGRGSLVSGISQENGRMIRKLREFREERNAAQAELDALKMRLSACTCGCAEGMDLQDTKTRMNGGGDGRGDRRRGGGGIFESMRSLKTDLDGEIEHMRAEIEGGSSSRSAPTLSQAQSPRRQQQPPPGRTGGGGGIFESMRSLATHLHDEEAPANPPRERRPRTQRSNLDSKRHGGSAVATPQQRQQPQQVGGIFESMRSLASHLSDETEPTKRAASSSVSSRRTGGRRRWANTRDAGDEESGDGGGGAGGAFTSVRSLPAGTFIANSRDAVGRRTKEIWSNTSTRLLEEKAPPGSLSSAQGFAPPGERVSVDFPNAGRRSRRPRGDGGGVGEGARALGNRANAAWSSTSTRMLKGMADEVGVQS